MPPAPGTVIFPVNVAPASIGTTELSTCTLFPSSDIPPPDFMSKATWPDVTVTPAPAETAPAASAAIVIEPLALLVTVTLSPACI